MPDLFDRRMGSLHGLPDVAHTRPATVRVITPLLGNSETFIVQTYRQAEQGELVDHLVLGSPGRWVSLKEQGGW
jgi:hypothetical protein